jgi:hypothetical protein
VRPVGVVALLSDGGGNAPAEAVADLLMPEGTTGPRNLDDHAIG